MTPGNAYPSVLILASDSDDRVDPMHARKFAARLQETTSWSRPVLFKILPHAGHFGAGRTDAAVEERTQRLNFLLKELKP